MSTTTLAKIMRHRAMLKVAVGNLIQELQTRCELHDLSKLRGDEFGGICALDEATISTKYGSDEQRAAMKEHGAVIDLHYSRNEHHPEHHAPGEMGWLDIVEMVCDWWAAWVVYDAEKDDEHKTTWGEVLDRQCERFREELTPFQMDLAVDIAAWLEPEAVIYPPEVAPKAKVPRSIYVHHTPENQVAFIVLPGRLSIEAIVDIARSLAQCEITRTAHLHYRWMEEWQDGEGIPVGATRPEVGALLCSVYDPAGAYGVEFESYAGEAKAQRELDVESNPEKEEGDEG